MILGDTKSPSFKVNKYDNYKFYKEGELSVLHDIKILSDNPDNQQGGVSVTVVSTHKIHLIIFHISLHITIHIALAYFVY